MNKPIGERLRSLLIEHPKGLTICDMSKIMGDPQETIQSALRRNYGFYVSNWQRIRVNHYRAVWSMVIVPASAPRPPNDGRLDDLEIDKDRKKREAKALKKQEALKRRIANAKIKAEMAIEKAQRKKIKEDIFYKPERTVWQSVAPWPKGEKA